MLAALSCFRRVAFFIETSTNQSQKNMGSKEPLLGKSPEELKEIVIKNRFRQNSKRNLSERKLMKWMLTFITLATKPQRAEHFLIQRHLLKSILNFLSSSQKRESLAQDFYSD